MFTLTGLILVLPSFVSHWCSPYWAHPGVPLIDFTLVFPSSIYLGITLVDLILVLPYWSHLVNEATFLLGIGAPQHEHNITKIIVNPPDNCICELLPALHKQMR